MFFSYFSQPVKATAFPNRLQPPNCHVPPVSRHGRRVLPSAVGGSPSPGRPMRSFLMGRGWVSMGWTAKKKTNKTNKTNKQEETRRNTYINKSYENMCEHVNNFENMVPDKNKKWKKNQALARKGLGVEGSISLARRWNSKHNFQMTSICATRKVGIPVLQLFGVSGFHFRDFWARSAAEWCSYQRGLIWICTNMASNRTVITTITWIYPVLISPVLKSSPDLLKTYENILQPSTHGYPWLLFWPLPAEKNHFVPRGSSHRPIGSFASPGSE